MVLIQESKKEEVDLSLTKAIWSSKDIGWAFVESCKNSGKLCGDQSKVQMIEVLKGGFTISVHFSTLSKDKRWISNIYGPCDYKERKLLWPEPMLV